METGPKETPGIDAHRVRNGRPDQDRPQRMIAALPGFRYAGVGGVLEVWPIVKGSAHRHAPPHIPLRCIQATGLPIWRLIEQLMHSGIQAREVTVPG